MSAENKALFWACKICFVIQGKGFHGNGMLFIVSNTKNNRWRQKDRLLTRNDYNNHWIPTEGVNNFSLFTWYSFKITERKQQRNHEWCSNRQQSQEIKRHGKRVYTITPSYNKTWKGKTKNVQVIDLMTVKDYANTRMKLTNFQLKLSQSVSQHQSLCFALSLWFFRNAAASNKNSWIECLKKHTHTRSLTPPGKRTRKNLVLQSWPLLYSDRRRKLCASSVVSYVCLLRHKRDFQHTD